MAGNTFCRLLRLGNHALNQRPTNAANLLVPVRKITVHQSSNVIAGPAQVKIPFAESVVVGIAMLAGMVATPCWVMMHLDDYRTIDKSVLLGGESEEE